MAEGFVPGPEEGGGCDGPHGVGERSEEMVVEERWIFDGVPVE